MAKKLSFYAYINYNQDHHSLHGIHFHLMGYNVKLVIQKTFKIVTRQALKNVFFYIQTLYQNQQTSLNYKQYSFCICACFFLHDSMKYWAFGQTLPRHYLKDLSYTLTTFLMDDITCIRGCNFAPYFWRKKKNLLTFPLSQN